MEADYPFDCDETFSYIAGYTENGVPFGITYEEEQDFDIYDTCEINCQLDVLPE
jgi:hypothetical protein